MKNLTPRKLTGSALAALLLLALAPAPASAWGNEGHRIVARIAMRLLNDPTRAEVVQLLGNDRLDNVALWADDIRGGFQGGQRPETKLWHFADIPVGEEFREGERYCARSPWGDCVIEALDRFNLVLLGRFDSFPVDKIQYANSRQEALKFIVHFVGDLHQPLHSADKGGDGGGNLRKVKFFGANSNLHSVWDSGILSRAMSNDGLTIVTYANRLHNGLTAEERNFARSTTPVTRAQIIEWANAANDIAEEDVYDGVADNINTVSTLGAAYFNANRGNVDSQLKLGGIRLARMLNSTLR